MQPILAIACLCKMVLTPPPARARYEDLGDGLNRDTLILGVNRYLVGHDAKVLFNYRSTSSDTGDADIFAVGFSLTF